jgi:hypothetical protein
MCRAFSGLVKRNCDVVWLCEQCHVDLHYHFRITK